MARIRGLTGRRSSAGWRIQFRFVVQVFGCAWLCSRFYGDERTAPN